VKYRPQAPARLAWYVLVQFLVFAPSVTALVRLRTALTWWELGVGAAAVAFGQLVLISLLESKRWARPSEFVRLLMLGAGTAWLTWSYGPREFAPLMMATTSAFVVVSIAAFVWAFRSPLTTVSDGPVLESSRA
jgi:hypothetical protein